MAEGLGGDNSGSVADHWKLWSAEGGGTSWGCGGFPLRTEKCPLHLCASLLQVSALWSTLLPPRPYYSWLPPCFPSIRPGPLFPTASCPTALPVNLSSHCSPLRPQGHPGLSQKPWEEVGKAQILDSDRSRIVSQIQYLGVL